jgi:hypothetical protein
MPAHFLRALHGGPRSAPKGILASRHQGAHPRTVIHCSPSAPHVPSPSPVHPPAACQCTVHQHEPARAKAHRFWQRRRRQGPSDMPPGWADVTGHCGGIQFRPLPCSRAAPRPFGHRSARHAPIGRVVDGMHAMGDGVRCVWSFRVAHRRCTSAQHHEWTLHI